MKPKVIVHGGAGEIPDEHINNHIIGCETAINIAWEILNEGRDATSAVEAAIKHLEDIPEFDAGKGSFLNTEGFVEMDAMIMNGKDLNIGSVAGITRVKNPIQLAKQIMQNNEHNMLFGTAALNFARLKHLEERDPEWFVTEYTHKIWNTNQTDSNMYGTVGCVALDSYGDLCAGTSTGGTKNQQPGRIGDSPLVGCGAYADNLTAGVSSTGNGEDIMKVVLSKLAADLTAIEESAQDASKEAINIFQERTDSQAGLIMIDSQGEISCSYNTPRMSRAWINEKGQIESRV